MAITNIHTITKRAGDNIVKKFLRKINKKRAGSKMPMLSSGSLGTGIHSEISHGTFTTLEIKGAKYGLALDKSTPTPFSWSGAGPKPGSDYIHGLVRWLGDKKKLYGRAALQAAFRIARTRKGKGSPANPGWIKEVVKDIEKETIEFFKTETVMSVNADISRALNKTI